MSGRLLERGPVQVELSGHLRAASEGSGRLVFLGGEAGVGKSSLVQGFSRRVDDQVRLLEGACDPLGTPRPLGPLHDMAGELGGRYRATLAGGAGADMLFRGFLEELGRPGPPPLVVFEDVHWADEATLDLLRFLGRRIDGVPALVVATYRDDEVGDRHPLRIVLGDLATAAGIRRLHLEPLSLDAVRALAAGTALDPVRLHERTGGNPFFVTEVIAAEGREMPATVRDAVLARAARLPAGAREALDAAAVLGFRFEPALIEAVMAPRDDALDRCLVSGLLLERGAHLTFRHELGRRAILEAVPRRRLRPLHAAALDALLERDDAAHDAGRLAHHAEGAGDAEAVLEHAPAAARRAAALSAHREAAAQYARALRFADDAPRETRAELLEAHAYECYLTDAIPEAIEARRKAHDLARRAGDRLAEGRNLRWLSRLSWFACDRAEAERTGRQAIEVLDAVGEERERAMAYSNWSQLRMLAGDAAEAREWGERSAELAERIEAHDILAHALNNIGTALVNAGEEAGGTMLRRSLAISLEARLEEHAARAYTNLGSAAAMWYRIAEADRALSEGIAYCADRTLDSWVLYMRSWLAVVRMHQGRWSEAERIASEVEAHPGVSPVSEIQALTVRGRIAARTGRSPGEALDRALDLARRSGEVQRVVPVLAARAETAWLRGDPGTTRSEAGAALDLATDRRHAWMAGELLSWVSRSGEKVTVPAWLARPFALQLEGRWDGAAAEWDRLGCLYEAAAARAETDDPDALRRALATFRRLGARPAQRAAERRLRALGVRNIPRGPRPSTRRNPAGLTPRQLEVARLLTEGLANREIAARLHITPKTAGHHVSAVLSKLGAASRTEAARKLADLEAQDREPVLPR